MSKDLSIIFRFAIAAGSIVAASVIGMPAAHAAAVPTSVSTLQGALADNATTVQYRRFYGGGWRGGAWRGGYGWRGYGRYPYRYGYGYGYGWPYYGAAFATGAVIGAAATAPYYYGGYGPGYGYYGSGYYNGYYGSAGADWMSNR